RAARIGGFPPPCRCDSGFEHPGRSACGPWRNSQETGMSRAIVFDVDGVLVHDHARPDLQQRWDENLLADLGIDPERFRNEFIFDIFIKKVVIGETPLIEALDRRLPGLGFKGSSMAFAHYWLSRDSRVNEELIAAIRQLKANAD